MGADEKHAATYHGGEYTPTKYMPTTDDVRDIWVDRKLHHLPKSTRTALVPTVQAEFNRWLDKIRFDAYNEGAEATHISGDLFDVGEAQTSNPYKENQS